MKAVSLIDVQVDNPLYDPRAHRKALRDRKKYAEPRYLDFGPGFEIEGPDCWTLCCPGPHNAAAEFEPADDECRDAVREWMEERRPDALSLIQQTLNNLESIKDADKRKHIVELAKSYGLKPQAKERATKGDGGNKK